MALQLVSNILVGPSLSSCHFLMSCLFIFDDLYNDKNSISGTDTLDTLL